ncbi:MAG: hypothetical protein KBB83_04735 [Alphaproteobacteria bacterium]|nr:hypothetical protein [Alphaproteobacteria bacterium]
MKVYFAWTNGSENYNPEVHNREDEKIFHMEISQREGGYSRARLVIQNPYTGLLWPKDKQFCWIACDRGPLFSGRILAMPSEISGELICVDFIACPEDWQAKQQALCQDIMKNGVYEPLFFSEEKPELKDLLHAYTALPYWDRWTGSLSLSDIFRGRKKIYLQGDFLRDSLKIQTVQNPLKAVRVGITAEWLQQAGGIIEIGQHIKKKCPQGYLSTLTSDSLESSWWSDKQQHPVNGYKLEKASLERIRPENERLFPKYSRSYWHHEDKPKKVQFLRSWYDVQMRFSWSYKQKRRETAEFELKHKTQDVLIGHSQVKNLSFNLMSILGKNHPWRPGCIYNRDFKVLHNGHIYQCLRKHASKEYFEEKKWSRLKNLIHVSGQSARAEFFATDRGQKALRYALDVAKAHLAASARCIHITLRAPWEPLWDVTLDHNVVIEDDRLPGKAVQGKVIAYRIVADGKSGEKLVEIKLGVSVGEGVTVTEAMPEEDLYAHEEYGAEAMFCRDDVIGRSASAIGYRISAAQEKPVGLSRPSALSEHDLVEAVDIFNDADSQESLLEKQQFPHTDDVRKVLKRKPTNLRIKLKDLSTHGCLQRRIHVDVMTIWSAPKHIDLSSAGTR